MQKMKRARKENTGENGECDESTGQRRLNRRKRCKCKMQNTVGILSKHRGLILGHQVLWAEEMREIEMFSSNLRYLRLIIPWRYVLLLLSTARWGDKRE